MWWKVRCMIDTCFLVDYMAWSDWSIDWLCIVLRLAQAFSLTWKRHYYRWKAAKCYGLFSAWGSLKRVNTLKCASGALRLVSYQSDIPTCGDLTSAFSDLMICWALTWNDTKYPHYEPNRQYLKYRFVKKFSISTCMLLLHIKWQKSITKYCPLHRSRLE
jgi:hypothetical protein